MILGSIIIITCESLKSAGAAAEKEPAINAGTGLYLDRHAVGVGTEGGSRGAGVGNSVGAGFTDVDLRGRDMELPTRHLSENKP